MSKTNELIGKQYGYLTVIKRAGSTKRGQSMWLCQCECGKTTKVRCDHLKNGETKSCGCRLKEQISKAVSSHGLAGTRLYRIWCGLKDRCGNSNVPTHKDYGARGITVCDEWKSSFEAFRDWALANGYRDDLTIDRIDVNGPYSPENCRWSTMKEQQNNRRNNRLITYNGKTQTLAQWAEETKINENTLRSRLKYGWSEERTLTEKPKKG